MTSTITLTRDYGYSPYRYSGGDADVINASDASWIVANMGSSTNPYPFLVGSAKAGLDVIGGTILGKVSQTLDWTQAYVNSAAVMLRNAPDAIVHDWTISQPWDGVRLAGSSGGFELDGIRVSNARDDAVENDDALSGTIRDSLFDGVFSGISLGNKNTPDRSGNVVTIDDVLLRMESYLYKGELTHGSPMKMESASPALRITNSVFAIEDVNHFGDWRLDLAWDKTINSSGNTFLNLSDTPLPSDYPTPGNGWTILQGQAARNHWEAARADWLAAHDNATADRTGSSGGADTLSVRVSGDAWEGDPTFALTINGVTVDASSTVTADRRDGEWQTITFEDHFVLDGSDRVGIRFLNDHWEGTAATDRNLYVDEVRLNDEINGTNRDFMRNGSGYWDF